MDDLVTADDLFEASGRLGYLHPTFAETYVEAGEVRHLRRSGAWMLTRPIPGSARRDALVGHPLLVCRDWTALSSDLAQTAALSDVVSVAASTDPLTTLGEAGLHEAFPDLVRVQAQHFVVDLPSFWPSRGHRRAVRRAWGLVDVDVEDSPRGVLQVWDALGGAPLPGVDVGLSSEALARQSALPGCVGFTVQGPDGPVAASIAYVSGEHAHLHAMACDAEGERVGARYALVQAMVEDMAGRGLRLLDLGSAAEDAAFMAGWTEATRPSYRCGRVIDRLAYAELVAAAGTSGSVVFPAYRDPAARLG